MCSEKRERAGTYTWYILVNLLASAIDGADWPSALHFRLIRIAMHLAIVIGPSASALTALKKRLVANLSAKWQLSVAKLSTKRTFSLAKWGFYQLQMAGWRPIFELWFSSSSHSPSFSKTTATAVIIHSLGSDLYHSQLCCFTNLNLKKAAVHVTHQQLNMMW